MNIWQVGYNPMSTSIPSIGIGDSVPLKKNTDEKKEGSKAPKSQKPGLAKRAIRHFFSMPKSKSDFLLRSARALLLGFVAIKTTPLYVALNESLQLSGFAPSSNAVASEEGDLSSSFSFVSSIFGNALYADEGSTSNVRTNAFHNVDNFVKNCNGFHDVSKLIKDLEIDIKTFDLNNNGMVFDSSDEIQALINNLVEKASVKDSPYKEQIQNAITKLKEIKELNQYIWGANGPSPNLIFQQNNECQITADIIGICLKDKHVQRYLKSNLKVKEFNITNPEDFFINVEININGKPHEVKYSELKFLEQYKDPDVSIGPYAFTIAIDKELKQNFLGVPSPLLSDSSTLITGTKYYTLVLPTMSDYDLIKLLEKAPETVIKFGTYPEYLNFSGSTEVFGNTTILAGHDYVVKGITRENNETKVIVKDATGEQTESLRDIRNHMLYIAAPAHAVSTVNLNDALAWSMTLLSCYLLTLAKGRLDHRKQLRLSALRPINTEPSPQPL